MSNKPRPFVIPVPLSAYDLTLLNRIITTVHKTPGLGVSDRLVLVAVLQHIPDTAAGNTASIDRILALSPANMKILAGLFSSGLLTARSWSTSAAQYAPISPDGNQSTPASGHQSGSGCSVPSYHWASVLYKDLFDSLKIPLFTPTIGFGGRGSVGEDLASALTTNSTQSLPPSIASVSNVEITFWLFLMVFLGPTLFNDLTQLIHEYNSNGYLNGLFPDAAMNWRFHKQPIAKIPCSIAAQPSQIHNPVVPVTSLIRAEYQTSISARMQYLQIPDSTQYRLFTNIAAKSEPSHPLLMTLHLKLEQMIYLSGLSLPLVQTHKRAAIDDAGDLSRQRGPRQQPSTGLMSRQVDNVEVRRKTPTVKMEANDDLPARPLGRGVFSWDAPTVQVKHRAPQQQAETSRGVEGNISVNDNSGEHERGEQVEGITGAIDSGSELEEGEVEERIQRATDSGSELEEGEVEEGKSTFDDDIPDFEEEEDEVRLVGMDPPHLYEVIERGYRQSAVRAAWRPY